MKSGIRKLYIAVITIVIAVCLTAVFASAQTHEKTVRLSPNKNSYMVYGMSGDTVKVSVYNLLTWKRIKASSCYRLMSGNSSVAYVSSIGKYAYISLRRKGEANIHFAYKYKGQKLKATLKVRVTR